MQPNTYDRALRHLLPLATDTDLVTVLAADDVCSCMHASEAAVEVTGYSAAELEHLGLLDLVHPDDVSLAREFLFRTCSSETPATTTCRLRTREGRTVVVRITARQVVDPLTGERAEFIASARPLKVCASSKRHAP